MARYEDWKCYDDNFQEDLISNIGGFSLWFCVQCKMFFIGEKIYCPLQCGCDGPELSPLKRFKHNQKVKKEFKKLKEV